MATAVLRQLETLQTLLDTIDPVVDADAGDKIAALALALRDAMARVAPLSDATGEADGANRSAF